MARIPGFNRATASPRCDDGEFLWRVMLDLVGFPPTANEVRSFVADAAPEKRVLSVDRVNPVPVHDLFATLFRACGVNSDRSYSREGRKTKYVSQNASTSTSGRPLRELF